METLALLYHDWSGPGDFHGGDGGFFHPGLFWLGLFLFFAMKRRWHRQAPLRQQTQPGRRAERSKPADDPNAPVWPDLYPDAPKPAAPKPEKPEIF